MTGAGSAPPYNDVRPTGLVLGAPFRCESRQTGRDDAIEGALPRIPIGNVSIYLPKNLHKRILFPFVIVAEPRNKTEF